MMLTYNSNTWYIPISDNGDDVFVRVLTRALHVYLPHALKTKMWNYARFQRRYSEDTRVMRGSIRAQRHHVAAALIALDEVPHQSHMWTHPQLINPSYTLQNTYTRHVSDIKNRHTKCHNV